MNTNVIEHLDRSGQRPEVDVALASLGLTRRTLNDPINRQRLITALEKRFPKWRKDLDDSTAE